MKHLITAFFISLLFTFPVMAKEFKCYPVPEIGVLGHQQNIFLANNGKDWVLKETISKETNAARFTEVETNIRRFFGMPAPWPIDEFLVFTPSPTGRFASSIDKVFNVAYSYKKCVLNFSQFPSSAKGEIIGIDL